MLDDRTIWFRNPVPGRSGYLPFRQLGAKLPAVQWIQRIFPPGESGQSISPTKYNHITPYVPRNWCCTSTSPYASSDANFEDFFFIINQLYALISHIYFGMKLYMFRTVPLSIIRSLITVHSAMVYVILVCRQLSSSTRMVLYFKLFKWHESLFTAISKQ
jgi:hypothetical protein